MTLDQATAHLRERLEVLYKQPIGRRLFWRLWTPTDFAAVSELLDALTPPPPATEEELEALAEADSREQRQLAAMAGDYYEEGYKAGYADGRGDADQ